MDIPIPPVGALLKSRAKAKRQQLYMDWRAGVPTDHMYSMIHSLRTMLKQRGYMLMDSDDKVAKSILQWAFSHVWVHRNPSKDLEINFVQSNHQGGPEEYDWFCHKISLDEWFTFCQAWATTEFLDDSDAGRTQCRDFSECIWHLIALNSSHAHNVWLDTVCDEFSDDEQYAVHHQEDYGFGGDRRTH